MRGQRGGQEAGPSGDLGGGGCSAARRPESQVAAVAVALLAAGWGATLSAGAETVI